MCGNKLQILLLRFSTISKIQGPNLMEIQYSFRHSDGIGKHSGEIIARVNHFEIKKQAADY